MKGDQHRSSRRALGAPLALGVLLVVVATADCGGSTFSAGLDGDAALDATSGDATGTGSSSGGGSSTGSSSSAASSGAPSGSSGSTSSSSGASSGGHASSGGSTSSGGSSSGTSSGGSSASGSSGSASSGGSGSASSGGGSSGSSGSGGGSGSSGGSGSGSGASSGGQVDAGHVDSGVSDAGGGCDASCGLYRLCCKGQCVNPANDPFNCGACGVVCGAGSYCNGSCQTPACSGVSCTSSQTCCGTSCCAPGQLCCQGEGPSGSTEPTCFTPTASQSTCPQGCAPLCVSDRDLKCDVEPVDETAVLERVSQMPVSTWSYKDDPRATRHLGPMAQDFHSAFGLGSTDRAYDPIDAHGVELAAIKALYERLMKDEAKLQRLEEENAELRRRSAPITSSKTCE